MTSHDVACSASSPGVPSKMNSSAMMTSNSSAASSSAAGETPVACCEKEKENNQVQDFTSSSSCTSTPTSLSQSPNLVQADCTIKKTPSSHHLSPTLSNNRDNNTAVNKRKASVRFGAAEIVEFEPTVWTATVSSGGVPIGMSVKVRQRTRRRLDSFEVERRSHRIDREEFMENGYLEPEERLDILESAGLSISSINVVEKEMNRINRERWESNEFDLQYQYGLGEVPCFDEDLDDDEVEAEDDDLEFSLPATSTSSSTNRNQTNQIQNHSSSCSNCNSTCATPQLPIPNLASPYCLYQPPETMSFEDVDDIEMRNFLEDEDPRSTILIDSEVNFAMQEMDCYDERKFQEYVLDYTEDCLFGENETTEPNDQLPYANESCDATSSSLSCLVQEIADLASSPSDVSASECIIVSASSLVASSPSSQSLAVAPSREASLLSCSSPSSVPAPLKCVKI